MAKTLLIGAHGYIGSELRKYIDCDVRGPIKDYDTIVLLAGHSSVAMCNNDPTGAWENNVTWFEYILSNLRDDQRLIYASSASVYNGIPGTVDEDSSVFNCTQMYDLTKMTIDQLAKVYDKHTYGLRFATVNGFSPVLRVDVMLNKMVNDAKESGIIRVSNSSLSRPILGIKDLCMAVSAIVESQEDRRGIYNLASFAKTVGEMAEYVADEYDAGVEILPDSPHYVFNVDTTKFCTTYNFRFLETMESIVSGLTFNKWEQTCIRV